MYLTQKANSIALTSTNNKGITLNPLYEVFAAVHRITLPRGLLCKSLHAKWRCSDVWDDVDMVMDMRIRGDCYADEAREATSLGSVKDVWSLLFSWGSFWVCSEAQCIDAAKIRIILEAIPCEWREIGFWIRGTREEGVNRRWSFDPVFFAKETSGRGDQVLMLEFCQGQWGMKRQKMATRCWC